MSWAAGMSIFLAVQEVFDGEDLEAGVFGGGDGFGLEEAGFGGFFAHGGGGGFEGNEDADGRFFGFEEAAEVKKRARVLQ
jgi:hypothetical protein